MNFLWQTLSRNYRAFLIAGLVLALLTTALAISVSSGRPGLVHAQATTYTAEGTSFHGALNLSPPGAGWWASHPPCRPAV